MMGVGAVKKDVKAMILSGFPGLVVGACSMAIGEFVSMYSQLDIEVAQMKRYRGIQVTTDDENRKTEREKLPSPLRGSTREERGGENHVESFVKFAINATGIVPHYTKYWMKGHAADSYYAAAEDASLKVYRNASKLSNEMNNNNANVSFARPVVQYLSNSRRLIKS
ncbi:hypothetical protein DCAR_0101278 [Daucus carota subsp. sativus]|uniref:Vacuolar iron transporter n=1 Tax=Daucus carota subsp. sativus TaxID=79200 RepID=A0A166G981_DAUCS|nr:hypothetical protein DCAR_0101278 [Daucus carota subsp. sativus]